MDIGKYEVVEIHKCVLHVQCKCYMTVLVVKSLHDTVSKSLELLVYILYDVCVCVYIYSYK